MVEGARLESVYTGNRIAGSNPVLSARFASKLDICYNVHMTSFEYESPQRKPEICYAPADDHDDVFQQLSVLNGMGYPVDMTIVRNDDEGMRAYFGQHRNDETLTKEAPFYPYWAKFAIDPEFTRLLEHPSEPGTELTSEDEATQRLLEKHPMLLVSDITAADVSMLHWRYNLHRLPEHADSPYRLAHERPEYPWRDVIARCIVAAALRYDRLRELPDPYLLNHASMSPGAEALAKSLMESGVPPINGEQVAGLVSGYYQLVESHFPEFKAFKR